MLFEARKLRFIVSPPKVILLQFVIGKVPQCPVLWRCARTSTLPEPDPLGVSFKRVPFGADAVV
jgi:hypothetical protein